MNLDLSGLSVMLCMPINRDMPLPTVRSLLATTDLMAVRGIPIDVHFVVGSSVVEIARTKCAHAFMESDKNRLFWVDSDMRWEAESFLRLLALSTKMPVVGATYPYKSEPIKFAINAMGNEVEANEYGCIPMKGFGLGFAVIAREVIERLSEHAPKLKFPGHDALPHIFRNDSIDGEFRGEDMAFFADAYDLGYVAYVDPTIRLGHVGQKTYEGALIDVLQKA